MEAIVKAASKTGKFSMKLAYVGVGGTNATETILDIPQRWLREIHPDNFDKITNQRIIPYHENTGKVLPMLTSWSSNTHRKEPISLRSCDLDESKGVLHTTWTDGKEMNYSLDWLMKEIHKSRSIIPVMRKEDLIYSDEMKSSHEEYDAFRVEYKDQTLWSELKDTIDADLLRSDEMSVKLSDTLTASGKSEALSKLYKYGVLLVKDTPVSSNDVNKKAIIDFANVIGYGPQTTLYGSVWSTRSDAFMEDGASIADSAYRNDALPLHTDMTYYREPPGLQVFCMVNAAKDGGESVLADGFSVGEMLRKENPQSFHILSKVIRRYWSIDKDNGWHLEADGTIIQCTPSGLISRIRHNDLDRLPDISPISDLNDFYEQLDSAHEKWNELLNRDENRLAIKVESGEMIVVSNQRVLHARHSFVTDKAAPRIISGCYVSQDDYYSRLRNDGIL